MIPVLTIGPVAVPTYPLLLLMAFWVGTWVAARQAEKFKLDGDLIYNVSIYGLLGGLLGARAWYVLTHWDSYAADLSQAFTLSRSALSMGEGLVIAGLVMLIYLQRSHISLGQFFDTVAPGLAVAMALVSLGAFLGGQALGQPTSLPWGIYRLEALRHPVPLYELLACLLIVGLLYQTEKWRPWPSFQFWLFVALYGMVKLLLEPLYQRPPVVGEGFLLMQVVGFIAMVVALAVMAYNFTNRKPSPAPQEV